MKDEGQKTENGNTDPDFASALALVHQRYSTNTFPTWELAHPFRMLAHNGEINTIRSNLNQLKVAFEEGCIAHMGALRVSFAIILTI